MNTYSMLESPLLGIILEQWPVVLELICLCNTFVTKNTTAYNSLFKSPRSTLVHTALYKLSFIILINKIQKSRFKKKLSSDRKVSQQSIQLDFIQKEWTSCR